MKQFTDFGIEIPFAKKAGNVKTFCPHCHDQRKDKRDKSLSVNIDKGIWHCHYCNWSGTLHVGERSHTTPRTTYSKPRPRPISPLSTSLMDWFKKRGISEQTISDLRISEGLEFMPQTGAKENTMQFRYYLNGELINVKYRTLDKLFKLESGAELIPYNLDSITGKSTCIITEGEMDCLSFIEAGYKNCISVPNGASNNLSYLDDFIDGWFEDKQIIYIATDTDQKGLLLREELIRRFGSERCIIITYGDDCKDANEHLVKYGADSLCSCYQDAKEVKVEGIFSLSDFEDSLDLLYQQGMPKGVGIGLENFDKLCSFETKRLAVVTGIPGSGKSEFIDQIIESLNVRHGWRAAFFSPENAPLQYHASKLIEKLTGKQFKPEKLTQDDFDAAKSYVNENFFFINPKDNFSVDNVLSKAKYLIRRHGIKALVIDPYNRLDINCGHNKETDFVRDILRKLINFAQQNDVLIFLMAHPTKQQKNKDTQQIEAPTLYDIAGSAHFYNMADYGIVVHRDRPNNRVEIKVSKVRFKHLGSVGTVYMKYNINNGRYVPAVEGQQPDWDNTSHIPISSKEQSVSTTPSPKTTTLTEQGVLFNSININPLIPQLYD